MLQFSELSQSVFCGFNKMLQLSYIRKGFCSSLFQGFNRRVPESKPGPPNYITPWQIGREFRQQGPSLQFLFYFKQLFPLLEISLFQMRLREEKKDYTHLFTPQMTTAPAVVVWIRPMSRTENSALVSAASQILGTSFCGFPGALVGPG